MESTAPDLSVREVLRAPTTTEFAGVEAFARRVTHRFRPMADTGRGYGDRLSAGIEARWTLPRHLDGLDVLDAQGFENMVHDWQSRRGYDDLAGEDRGPFVIPVDPVEDIGGYTATDAVIGRGRERLRAVVPQARPTPRQSAPARERWRNAGKGTFSPYPAALGNAGRIEGSLLRFPEARAVATAGVSRALVVDDAQGGSWGQVAPFAAAARSAERTAGEIVARSQPAPTTPVGLWLERAESTPIATPTSAPSPRIVPLFADRPALTTRAPGRWQGNTFAGVVHAPETPSQAPGRLAQQFLDAPPADGPMLSSRAFEALPGYETEAFTADRDFIAPMFATPTVAPESTAAEPAPRRRAPTLVAPAPLPGTPAAIAMRTPEQTAATPATQPRTSPTATTTARLATSPLVIASPRVTSAVPSLAVARAHTFQVSPALQAPLATTPSDAAFPSLTRAEFVPSATRAAAAAESAPLARRLAAEADETPALAQARFEVAPRAPELWSGLDVSETTLVRPTAGSSQAPASEGEPRGLALPGRARRHDARAPVSTRPSARTILPSTAAPDRPGGRASPARRTPEVAPAPMSRASIAQVVLPALFNGRMGAVAHGLIVPVSVPRVSPAAQAAERAVERLVSPTAAAARADSTQTASAPKARTRIAAQLLAGRDAPTEPGGRSPRSAAAPLASYSETFVDSATARATQRFTLDAGLPLASAPQGHVAQGIVAADIAELIAARFPTEEDGPWGPRVVLPGRDLALVEDAPTAELVQPTAERDTTPEVTEGAQVRPRRTPPAPQAQERARAEATTAPTAPTPRTPTLLTPGRPGLPGALSPSLANRTSPAAALAAANRRVDPATAVTTVSGSPRANAAAPGSRSSATQRPGTTAPVGEKPKTRLAAALGLVESTPTAQSPRPTADARVELASPQTWRATAEAFGPAAVFAQLTLRFGLRVEEATAVVRALTPKFGGFAAADAALRMAPQSGAAPTPAESRAEALGRRPAGPSGFEPAPLSVAVESRLAPATNRLVDELDRGTLVQAPTLGDAPVAAEPTTDAATRATPLRSASATPPTDASTARPQRGRPPLGEAPATPLARPAALSAGYESALSAGRPMAVLRVAGHTVLVPAAMAAALRQSGAEPAVLRALARAGSPALASLLAEDAPTAVFLEALGDREPAGDTTTAPGAVESARSAGRAAGTTPSASRSNTRNAARLLAAAGFTEPRGLRPWPSAPSPRSTSAGAQRAHSNSGANTVRPTAPSGWDPPTLASLVLPEGRTASPEIGASALPEAFRVGNLDRALVAFEQAAQRNPGAVMDAGGSGSGTASTFLKATGGTRSGRSAPGALATPTDRTPANVSTLSVGAADDRALVNPTTPTQSQPLFGNRGPNVTITTPSAPASRVMVDTGARRAGGSGPLKSEDGERPARQAETGEDARHRLAEGQIEESLSPEELDKIAHEVISQLKRQIELDAIRVGEDEWD
jgi:hypothetical protein